MNEIEVRDNKKKEEQEAKYGKFLRTKAANVVELLRQAAHHNRLWPAETEDYTR